MELSDYENILSGAAIPVECDGETHYINGEMNSDVFTVMSGKDSSNQEKTLRLIACVVCNEKGVRIFDVNNKQHLAMVKSFGMPLQTALITKAQEKFFPNADDSKKKLKTTATQSLLLYSLKNWASQFVNSSKA